MNATVGAVPIVSIYGLVDPETGLLRYVGQAVEPEKRLRQHLAPWNLERRSWKNSWLKSLGQRSLEPKLEILQVVPAAEADNAERWWIAAWKPSGWLTNGTDGGDGLRNPSAEVRGRIGWRKFDAGAAKEIRERFAAGETTVELADEFGVGRHTIGNVVRGKTWPNAGGPITEAIRRRVPPQALEAAREATLGKQRSDEVRKKIGDANRGQVRPSMQGELHHQAKLTVSEVLRIRERAEQGESFVDLGHAYGVSRVTIRQIVLRETWGHI